LRFAARDVSGAFAEGTYEMPIQQALARCLKSGDVFYDVGANVGFFSILAGWLVGAGGSVHAFEPVPSNADTIGRNLRLNGLSNVQVHSVAVSEASGQQELLISRHRGGAALASAVATVPDVTGKIVVPTVAIDDLIEQCKAPPPTMIKVDVEGAELNVLRGMHRTLRTHRPVLLYEVDDAEPAVMHTRWNELDELVEKAGYRIERMEDAYPTGGWSVGHSLALPSEKVLA
jgi:FkbM family methyltransferase